MSLAAGARLGPYEVVSALGAGGMGEVYRARDTRLDRTVALKVLRAHLSGRADLRERFEREARAVSALNHPHICALYDVGRQDDVEFLVMEYLEGETLAARLAPGALPLDQVLRYGIETADALDHAHRHGVTHRDLKPGNIMLTKAGVKVLDFGLARIATAEPRREGATALPTESMGLTAEGAILGTMQYMAPEQLEGKKADARSDIFGLGAVLFEMATGRKAFTGSSPASLIGNILHTQPPTVSAVQAMSPPALDRVVQRCLAKDPDDRWQSARDLMKELEWVGTAPAAVPAPAPAPAAAKPTRLPWIVAAVAVVVALVAAGLAVYFRHAAPPAELARFLFSPPERTFMQLDVIAHNLAVSPDGRRVAFVPTSEGRRQIWIRSIDQLESKPLAGTEDASSPFWSPDSRFLAFFSGGQLKKIAAAGGPPQSLCTIGAGAGSWGAGGTILVSVAPQGMYRISDQGGEPAPLSKADPAKPGVFPYWPHFLPDGRRFVYVIWMGEGAGLYAASLDGGQPKFLGTAGSRVVYVPSGHLLYVRDGTLLAQPFDAAGLRFTGEAVPVADKVRYFQATRMAMFGASDNGVVAYQFGLRQSRLVWLSRNGAETGAVAAAPGYYDGARLSPDGRRAAVGVGDPRSGVGDIWIYETASDITTRFTFDPGADLGPVWSPDGRRIIFGGNRGGLPPDLFQKALGGAAEEKLPGLAAAFHWPQDWSRDGRYLLYAEPHPKNRWDLWALPMSGEKKPMPIAVTPFEELRARLSPDGRWVAFVSDESGRPEVYVQPFPGPGEKRRVSTAGGDGPRWRGDGKEMFYYAADGRVMAVPLRIGAAFEAAAPVPLFRAELVGNDGYDVAADGQRFLANVAVAGAEPIAVVLNWTAALRR